MGFQVNFKTSHRCIEKELESSTKTKASTPLHQLILRRRSGHLSVFGIIFTHVFMCQRGESSFKRALMIPFLAIYAKGGESMSAKQKDRTTTNFKIFSLSIWFQRSIFKLVSYV
jgi:hypothetical protein